MRRISFWICLWIFTAWPANVHGSVTLLSSATTQNGEGGFGSVAVDFTGGNAYFGSSTTFLSLTSTYSAVVPTTLSPLAVNIGVGYYPLVVDLEVAGFDTGTRFAYFISTRTPVPIEMIPFGGTGISTSSTINTGQAGTMLVDSTNHIGYLGTLESPAHIVKLKLPDGVTVTSITVISSITLSAAVSPLTASVMDDTNGFAYFASSSTPGAVAKIKLSDFSLAGTLTFQSGEGPVGSAVIDVTNQRAYFGTHESPGKVVEIRLTDFKEINSITLQTGQNDLVSAVLDSSRRFAYFGTNTSPGIIVPILLTTFSRKTALTLASGQDFLRSAFIDTTPDYAYFGTFTTPAQVIQVDLLGGAPDILSQSGDATVHPGETVALSVTADGRTLSYQWQRNGADISGATSPTYSFVASATDDGAAFDCVITGANGSTTSRLMQLTIIPIIRAFPNPWRADRHTGVDITFDGLLPNSTVKIFTLSSHWVKTLPLASGSATWNRTNDSGETVASGYYFYLVTTGKDLQTTHGKLAIIR